MSQIIYPITHLPPVIDIGKQTERGVTRIGFDMHEWLDDWPGMKFSVHPIRPGETESYFAESEMVGSVVFWLVGAVDTEKPGSGTVEVLGVTQDERKLSAMCRTSIANTNTATTAEIPEPNRPWVDQVILAGEGAKAGAQAASKSATAAAEDAEKASQAAVDAENSVKDFFIVKIPFISKTNPQKTDKTQAEIIEAINAGKVCMLVATLYNRVYDGASIEDGAPVFRRYGFDNKSDNSFAETVTVNADGTVTSYYTEPILTPSPGVLHFRGAVTASYNGGKHVTINIPEGGLPETADPLKQLVTDADGKVTWEDRLAYETEREVVNLEPTELSGEDDDGDGTNDGFFLVSPWLVDIKGGNVYEVTYNGVPYECNAVEVSMEGQTICLLGNIEAMGMGATGGNPDAPFFFAVYPNAVGQEYGFYGMFIPTDGATSVTISVRGVEHTIKTIDPKYLGKKTITLTVGEDGTVTSDTPLADVWDMTPAELQSSIVIVGEGKMLNGAATYSNATKVYKTETALENGLFRGIGVQYERNITDPSDSSDNPVTKYINWIYYGGGESLVRDRYMRYEMPLMYSAPTSTMYLRWNPVGGKWVAVTIDQLKADLGLT